MPVLIVAALAFLFICVGLVQASRDAPAVDEVVDLTAGLVAVEHRDLRMNPEHGLVPHVGSALLPALLADPLVPRTASYEAGDWFDYTDDLVRANADARRLDEVVFWFRVAPVVVGGLTGLLLYRLAASLFGQPAGALAGALWLTTPYVVGVAHLGTVDVWYAAALTVVAIAALRLWRRATLGATATLAVTVAAAALVRHQALVLVAVSVVVVVVHRSERPLLHVGVALLLPLALIWGAYRAVDSTPVKGSPGERFEQLIDVAASAGPVERLVVSAPLPVEWRAGVSYLFVTSEPRDAYVLGEHWRGSRPWYFAASALVKVPLSASALLLLGLVGWSKVPSRRRRAAILTLAVGFGAEALLLHVQPLNLGLRLALPLLALGCVVAGPAVLAFSGRARVASLGTLGVLQLIAFAAAHPNSLAWTPPPFSDGYRYVSDSSIDIAQATDALRERHTTAPVVAASLLLPRGLDGIREVPAIEDQSPDALVGDVAVGATNLTVMRFDELSWLRAYCPVELVADAVLIYRFEAPPDVSPGPSMPAAPCDQAVSTR